MCKYVCILLVLISMVFQMPVVAQPLQNLNSSEIITLNEPDPLAGELERESKRDNLLSLKRNSTTAALLSLAVPGLGHMYYGDSTRGATIIAGIFGIALFSFIGTVALAGTENKFAYALAIILSGGSYTAYMAWSATDAYYRTEMLNHSLDDQIKQLVNIGGGQITLFQF